MNATLRQKRTEAEMDRRSDAMATVYIEGIEAKLAEVRVSTNRGGRSLEIRGMPEKAAEETRWRVYDALHMLKIRSAADQLFAEIRPESDWPHELWDLPVTLAIAQHQGLTRNVGDTIVTGALGQGGKVIGIRGTAPVALLAARAGRTLMLPAANLREAALAGASALAPVDSIGDAVEWFAGKQKTVAPPAPDETGPTLLLEEIVGHRAAKRALTIAATGRHNVLITSGRNAPPFALSRRMPAMMAEPTAAERQEVLAIHSIAGLVEPTRPRNAQRPLRAPHWTVSAEAIGRDLDDERRKRPQAGEAALAHHGVLVLDEIDGFGQQVIDRVRRHAGGKGDRTTYPSDFVLVGIIDADGDPGAPLDREARQQAAVIEIRKSGTADLFDISFDVEAAGREETEADLEATTAAIHDAASSLQEALRRKGAQTHPYLSSEAAALLSTAKTRHGNQAATRIRAVATTIAHLEARGIATRVGEAHVREATELRGILDRCLQDPGR